jgi:hypothetical protein
VRVDQLDGYVWESIKELLQDPQRVMDEWSSRASSDTKLAHLRLERDESERFLRAQEKILSRLRDAYEAGALDLQDLVQRSERVRTRIEKAKEDLIVAEKALSETIELSEVIGRLSDFSEKVRVGLANLSWLQRRQIVRTLISRVEIDGDGATIVYRVPAGSVCSRQSTSQKANDGGGDDLSSQLCWSVSKRSSMVRELINHKVLSSSTRSGRDRLRARGLFSHFISFYRLNEPTGCVTMKKKSKKPAIKKWTGIFIRTYNELIRCSAFCAARSVSL